MANIVQAGDLNTTAQVVPDVNIIIVPPKVANLNGVPTDVLAVVGTAPDGPVGVATRFSDQASFEAVHGKVQNRKHDMGTAVLTAAQQGAKNFVGIRVTDGTDTVATKTHQTGTGNTAANAITFTSVNTGSNNNNLSFRFSAGSKAYSVKAVIENKVSGTQEVYDNLPQPPWSELANAIASGDQRYARSAAPSKLVTAVANAANSANAVLDGTTYYLAGGTDGAANVNSVVLLGSDGVDRKGMYALRGQGASVGVLADCDDRTTWTEQGAFGKAEGIYFVVNGPTGDTIANATAGKATAGLDDYAVKVMHGDFLDWNDKTNGIVRKVAPAPFAAGRLANLAPSESSLNKPLAGIVGSQKVGAGTGRYSQAELQELFLSSIDLITNPTAGGSPGWAVRRGCNSSSNFGINGDNYTRMTNYLAKTCAAGLGGYIGQKWNMDTGRAIQTSISHFLDNLISQGQLALQEDGSLPYSVVCDASNNPQIRTADGYVQVDVKVRYQSIICFLNVNIEAGQSVTVTSTVQQVQ